MTQLYLHIGPHKTGSTFIQKVFFDHRERLGELGVHYPNLGFAGQFGQHDAVEKVRTLEQQPLQEYLAQFIGGELNFVSSENFDRLNQYEVRKLRNALPGVDVKIVYYYRNHIDLLPSWWQEDVKHGSTVSFFEYVLPHILRPFASNIVNPAIVLDLYASVFGKDNIVIIDYNAALRQDTIVSPLMELMGVELPDIANASVNSLTEAGDRRDHTGAECARRIPRPVKGPQRQDPVPEQAEFGRGPRRTRGSGRRDPQAHEADEADRRLLRYAGHRGFQETVRRLLPQRADRAPARPGTVRPQRYLAVAGRGAARRRAHLQATDGQRSRCLMRTRTLLALRSPLAGIAAAACLLSTAVAADKVKLGINYNWFQLRADQVPDCGAHPAWVLFGGGIIQQYHDRGIRDQVRGQLARMHGAGFATMRIILHASHLPADHKEGLIHTASGDISGEDQENIRNFTADVAAAGFQGLEVAFGFQQEGKIFCKQQEWGDCFDPLRTDANWRFIDSATGLVKAAAQSMSLRFDLNNEGCIAPSMPAATRTHAKAYLATIATRFREKYGNDEWLVSCPDSERGIRLRALLDGLRESGLKPKFVEIHTYKEDPGHVTDVVAAANDMAREIDAKVILGELRYHSGVQEKIVHDFIRAPGSRIIEVLQWPLADQESRCPIDVQPPYDLGPYSQD